MGTVQFCRNVFLRKLGDNFPILVEKTLDSVIQWIIYNDLTAKVVLHVSIPSSMLTLHKKQELRLLVSE